MEWAKGQAVVLMYCGAYSQIVRISDVTASGSPIFRQCIFDVNGVSISRQYIDYSIRPTTDEEIRHEWESIAVGTMLSREFMIKESLSKEAFDSLVDIFIQVTGHHPPKMIDESRAGESVLAFYDGKPFSDIVNDAYLKCDNHHKIR